MINPHIFVLSIAALVAVYMHFKKETREMELEFKYNRHKSYDKFGRVVYINDDDDDNDDELSFLETNKVVDVENQLRFDILKDVYLTKKNEADEIRNAASVKAHNKMIDELIASKQESKLKDMSIEELEKLRK